MGSERDMDRRRRAAAALLVLAVLGAAGCSRTTEPGSPTAPDAPVLDAGPDDGAGADQPPVPTVEPLLPRTPKAAPVSPASFGARGDGVTDDTAALQRAIDSAAERDAAVELAPNTRYLLSRALLLPTGTHLTGAGPSTQLQFTWKYNDSEHDGFYLGNRDQVGEGNQDITLSDFSIVGAASGLPAGLNELHHEPRVPAIRLRLVERFEISGLDIGYAPGISIIHQGCSEGTIVGNRIHHSGRDGINGTWHVENMHDVLIQDNLITQVGDDAIAVIGTPGDLPNRESLPYDILIKDNVVRGWATNPNGLLLGRGIVIMAATRVAVVGNVVARTHSAGILVAPSTRPFSYDPTTGRPWRSEDISVLDNEVTDAGQNYDVPAGSADTSGRDGLLVKQADRVWAADNKISNPLGDAVAFFDCRDCVGGSDR